MFGQRERESSWTVPEGADSRLRRPLSAPPKRFQESIAAYQQAAEIAQETGNIATRAMYLYNLANVYNMSGAPAQAITVLGEILPALATKADAGTDLDRFNYGTALHILTEGLALQSKPEQAKKTYTQAWAMLETADPDFYPMLQMEVLQSLATSRLQRGRCEQAVPLLEQALCVY